MEPLTYRDTRGLDRSQPVFTGTVLKGIAEGGGLYVPAELPRLELEDIVALAEMPYWQRAAWLFGCFRTDVPDDRVADLMREAYGEQWDDDRIAPVEEVTPEIHVLELWHGPTQAFKDMALQSMPRFFAEAIEMRRAEYALAAGNGSMERPEDYLILVATSGDTGKAALEGYADRPHTRIAVFYPAEGVSDIQRKQMVTQRGDNVAVFGVRGNFDDCQTAVKDAFSDPEFNRELHERHNLKLSSANSINWGRLLPQVAYYVSAYADMVASGGVREGDPVDFCVPTGNFGNILAGYYAKRMGVPIGRLICASNENRVLADFIATGTYDISSRNFVLTPSPSMDILVSSNLERLLFDLAGPESVQGWMRGLAEERRFQVDRGTFQTMRQHFAGDFVTNEESLATIRRVYDEQGYLLDPHTAVAWEVAERMVGDNPIVVVSTAHWAKFGQDVYKALSGLPYSAPLPEDVRNLTGVELLAKVQEMAPEGACVPRVLAELDIAKERFAGVVDAGKPGVESAVREWLG